MVKIVVDDRLAIRSNNKRLKFARMGKQNAFWPIILEKAYAKLNVNYLNINNDYPIKAFRDLTGMPVQRIDIRN